MLQPEPGGGAVRVREHRRAARHHRLAPVDLRHRHPAPLEAVADAIDDRFVEVERNLKQPRDGGSRDVVLGGAEPAGHHDQVGPSECRPQQLGELLDVVAGDQLEPHVDADFVEPLGDEQRIRIDAEGRQHLRADGDDTGSHRPYPVTAWISISAARSARFA